ncbi:hypothetical protein BLL42_27495 (plasmid) [Pseudomonas frederiksbergensis]|uniref:Uncharacterized protein n=1 Tax=Pseudomonas frederiksbergensis TaxID=104087 RepID=A0A1J0ETK5_9PSED|nr:hypothetical protein BLL42_27495 [Pseudomonas frederiksbergensis]
MTISPTFKDLNPFCQVSITAAKAQYPGLGVGPAVATELLYRIASGEITSRDQIPAEYQHLSTFVSCTVETVST